jgi:hypothetical protein
MVAMLFLYYKIFKTIRSRAKKNIAGSTKSVRNHSTTRYNPMNTIKHGSYNNNNNNNKLANSGAIDKKNLLTTAKIETENDQTIVRTTTAPTTPLISHKDSTNLKNTKEDDATISNVQSNVQSSSSPSPLPTPPTLKASSSSMMLPQIQESKLQKNLDELEAKIIIREKVRVNFLSSNIFQMKNQLQKEIEKEKEKENEEEEDDEEEGEDDDEEKEDRKKEDEDDEQNNNNNNKTEDKNEKRNLSGNNNNNETRTVRTASMTSQMVSNNVEFVNKNNKNNNNNKNNLNSIKKEKKAKKIKKKNSLEDPAKNEAFKLINRGINILRLQSNALSSASNSKERKVTKTLAIVLCVFLVCWTPFFTINNIILASCKVLKKSCNIIEPEYISFLSWLGYLNSLLNPVIYTIFNIEFRKAFANILSDVYFCKKKRPRS